MRESFALVTTLAWLSGCYDLGVLKGQSDAAAPMDFTASPPDVADFAIDSAVDQPRIDAALDQRGADLSLPDLAAPDLATPDFTTPDFTTPDFTTPDFTTPDFTTPDFTTPDLALPDQSGPDFAGYKSCANGPILVRPTADVVGTTAGMPWEFQFPATGQHWQKVNEAGSGDGDGSYIYTTVDDRWDEFEHEPLMLYPGATIDYVIVLVRARTTNVDGGWGPVGPGMAEAGIGIYDDRMLTTSYTNVSRTFLGHVLTGGPWTVTNFNRAHLAVRKPYTGPEVRVTQVWAEVYCSGP